MADVPYQNAAQVEQLLQERETAEAYGQETRVAAADKTLASFGITTKADRAAAAKHRQAAAEEADDDGKKAAPAGRSSKPRAKA